MNNTFIIAEAGVNHNGDITLAKKLIDAAKDAGADAVKFQTFKASSLVSQQAPKAAYQIQNTDKNETQLEMIKKLELSADDHLLLQKYSQDNEITFLSSAFDLESIDFLESIGMDIYKIPSGEITNLPYLKKIGSLNKEIILSTGMATLEEIQIALSILQDSGASKEKITVLHCNTEYPTPMRDVNLNAMNTIKQKLGVSIGYSDHTLGIEISIAAVALGAKVIEKHFTLDRNLPGPDHKASLEPIELKKMVDSIRNIEMALGNGEKTPSESEKKNTIVARKSIVAKTNIKKGELLSEKNITTKRPGSGISPMKWEEVLGQKAIRGFSKDELIEC